MGFISNIKERVAERVQAIQEKAAFLNEVEAEAKPIRREAYKKELINAAVMEGRLLAQKELQKKTKAATKPEPSSEKTKDIVQQNWGISDPTKYLPQLNKKDKK